MTEQAPKNGSPQKLTPANEDLETLAEGEVYYNQQIEVLRHRAARDESLKIELESLERLYLEYLDLAGKLKQGGLNEELDEWGIRINEVQEEMEKLIGDTMRDKETTGVGSAETVDNALAPKHNTIDNSSNLNQTIMANAQEGGAIGQNPQEGGKTRRGLRPQKTRVLERNASGFERHFGEYHDLTFRREGEETSDDPSSDAKEVMGIETVKGYRTKIGRELEYANSLPAETSEVRDKGQDLKDEQENLIATRTEILRRPVQKRDETEKQKKLARIQKEIDRVGKEASVYERAFRILSDKDLQPTRPALAVRSSVRRLEQEVADVIARSTTDESHKKALKEKLEAIGLKNKELNATVNRDTRRLLDAPGYDVPEAGQAVLQASVDVAVLDLEENISKLQEIKNELEPRNNQKKEEKGRKEEPGERSETDKPDGTTTKERPGKEPGKGKSNKGVEVSNNWWEQGDVIESINKNAQGKVVGSFEDPSEVKEPKPKGEREPKKPKEKVGKEESDKTPQPTNEPEVEEFRVNRLRKQGFEPRPEETEKPKETPAGSTEGKTESKEEKDKLPTLDEARAAYIKEYKGYVASRKGPAAWARKKLGLPLVDESKAPEELRQAKEAYEAAMVRTGKEKMEVFRYGLKDTGLTAERIEELAKKQEAEFVTKDLIMAEREKLDQAKVESYPPKERGFLMRSFEWYRKQPAMLRALIGGTLSVGVGTGAVLAAPAVLAAAGFGATAAAISGGSMALGSLVGFSMFAGQRYLSAFASAAFAPVAVKLGKAYETIEMAATHPFKKDFWTGGGWRALLDRNIALERLKQRREQEREKLFTGASLEDIKKLRAGYDQMLETHRRKDFWRQVRKIGVTTAGAVGISLLVSGCANAALHEACTQAGFVPGAAGGALGTTPGSAGGGVITGGPTGPGGTPGAGTAGLPDSMLAGDDIAKGLSSKYVGPGGTPGAGTAGLADSTAFEAAQGKFGGLNATEAASIKPKYLGPEDTFEAAQGKFGGLNTMEAASIKAPYGQEAFIGQIPQGGNVTKTLEQVLLENRTSLGIGPGTTDPKELAVWARKTAVQLLHDNPKANLNLVHANDQVAVALNPDGKLSVSVLERSGFKPMKDLPIHSGRPSVATPPEGVVPPPPTVSGVSPESYIDTGVSDVVRQRFGGSALWGALNSDGMRSPVWQHARGLSAREVAGALESDYDQLGFGSKNDLFRAKDFLKDVAKTTGVSPDSIPKNVSVNDYARQAFETHLRKDLGFTGGN